jgi:hypothetical protein
VTATGGQLAAGIGGGREGAGGIINISGTARVTATGGGQAAGIGGGYMGDSGVISISDSVSVTAVGDVNGYGAGIGGGAFGDGNTITISGNPQVTATGYTGIGSGGSINDSCGDITISGGTINATGSSAGIGSYGGSGNGSIEINGGRITATANGSQSFGIASDWGGTVRINGGTVAASGATGNGYYDIRGGTLLSIVGGSVNPVHNRVYPAPGNRHLNVLQIGEPGAANLKVAGYSGFDSYLAAGWTDVYTDAEGKLYLWLTDFARSEHKVQLSNNLWYSRYFVRPSNTTLYNGAGSTSNRINITTGQSDDGWTFAANDDWDFSSGVLTLRNFGNYEVYGTGATSNRVSVASDVNLTLNGVEITAPNNYSPIDFAGYSGDLILKGTNKLAATREAPGLKVSGGTLAISESGAGSLETRGAEHWPGIGGQSTATILNINSGTILAYGGANAAGIGSSNSYANGTININGGDVTAVGGEGGAGIGGGRNAVGGTINIGDGRVDATGGAGGAGIGGGATKNGGNITINGGMVTARRGSGAADIGKGSGNPSGGTTVISGGSVNPVNKDVNPVATRDGGTSVYLTTLDFDPAQTGGTSFDSGSLGSLTYSNSYQPTNGVYGSSGVTTDANGKLYFFLPVASTSETVQLLKGGTAYSRLFPRAANHNTAATLTEGTGYVIDLSETSPSSGTRWVYDSGTKTYTLSDGANVVIKNTDTTGRHITVAAGATVKIELENAHFGTTDSNHPLEIGNGASVDMTLTGNSGITATGANIAGIFGYYSGNTQSLTIHGPGSLDVQSGQYTAMLVNSITIDSGAVTAQGGGTSPAIDTFQSGGLTISGGTVKAAGGTTASYDIGNDGYYAAPVRIIGGSVNAPRVYPAPTNGLGSTVYFTTLDFSPALAANTSIANGRVGNALCAVTADAANGVYGIRDVKTDSSGKVYFFLPQQSPAKRVSLVAAGDEYFNTFTFAAAANATLAKGGVDYSALIALITTATNLKNGVVIGVGNGEYEQSVVDTFAAAIVTAQGYVYNASTQQTVTDATTALQTAIDDFNGGANGQHGRPHRPDCHGAGQGERRRTRKRQRQLSADGYSRAGRRRRGRAACGEHAEPHTLGGHGGYRGSANGD